MDRDKNEALRRLISDLRRLSIEADVGLWRRVAADLERPTRRQRQVNLFKIDACCADNETVLVPGKVLGLGTLSKKVRVAAYTFSAQARSSLADRALSIPQLMQENPKGKGVRILA